MCLVWEEKPAILAALWVIKFQELHGKLHHLLIQKTHAEDGTDHNGEDAHGEYPPFVVITFGV